MVRGLPPVSVGREVGVDIMVSLWGDTTLLPLDPSDLRCVVSRGREHSRDEVVATRGPSWA